MYSINFNTMDSQGISDPSQVKKFQYILKHK